MKMRNRQGNEYTIPYPLHHQQLKVISRNNNDEYEQKNETNTTTNQINKIHHSMELYMTVMKRLSCAFGTILQSSPPQSTTTTPFTSSSSSSSITNTNDDNNNVNNNSVTSTTSNTNNEEDKSTSEELEDNDDHHNKNENNITNENYWQHDKPLPIKSWKATIKRGFVHPPSATMYTTPDKKIRMRNNNSSFGQWTNPPILELFPGYCGDGMIDTSSDSGRDSSGSNEKNVNKQMRGPSFVRVTIQGIPSSFWNHDEEIRHNHHDEHNDVDNNDRNNTEEENGEDSMNTRQSAHSSRSTNTKKAGLRDDMVPISLVFEACFHLNR